MNVSEKNRAKIANIFALAICIEKAKFGRLRGFFDNFSAAVPADGGCFDSAPVRHIHTNPIL